MPDWDSNDSQMANVTVLEVNGNPGLTGRLDAWDLPANAPQLESLGVSGNGITGTQAIFLRRSASQGLIASMISICSLCIMC